MKCHFIENVRKNPIIASLKDYEDLDLLLHSNVRIVFFLKGTILDLQEPIRRVQETGKLVFVHFDLINGFSKDTTGLDFFIRMMKPDGIISTKSNLIKFATREQKIYAIQRMFILDSLNLESGIKSLKVNKPDAVEILPGIIPRIAKSIAQQTSIPVITGGLIKEKEDIIKSLEAEACGISTSYVKFWNLDVSFLKIKAS
jgi:glycerol uptake operon antiterminator